MQRDRKGKGEWIDTWQEKDRWMGKRVTDDDDDDMIPFAMRTDIHR